MPETQTLTKVRRKRLRTGRALVLALFLVGVVLVVGAAGVIVAAISTMPDWNPALIGGAMTTTVYDNKNEPVATLHGTENRYPVSLDKIPKSLREAVIATEDNRFYQHHGLDPWAIARAVVVDIRAGSFKEGASTITQQLAGSAFLERSEKSLKRKVQEAIMAVQLERLYKKDEILEFYLNEIYFGHGAYGVQAAARTYFDKNVEDLNLAESAMLAGIIRSPGTYSPLRESNLTRAKQRQNLVLDNMVRYGYITPAEAQEAKQTELEFTRGELERGSYRFPYYLDYVIEEAEELLAANGLEEKRLFSGGLKIYTALDTKTQEKMQQVYANAANFPKSPDDEPVQSAMVVLDAHQGGIAALIGGREHEVKRGWNRATDAKRQPGSSIKPIAVYAPALEEAGYSPATVIDDVPVSFPGGYNPRNYDNRYRGLVNLREALRWSINVVAVKVLSNIGVETGYNFAWDLGIPVTPDSKNLSLALGAVETSPLTMAAAYAAFANGGVWNEPHAITTITDRFDRVLVEVKPRQKEVMSEQTAFLITDMLQTVVREGTGTRARLDRPVAGKTGTTQLPDTAEFKGKDGTRDAWFIGYTSDLVGAVWMGYDHTDGKHYLRNVAGGTYPAGIWKAVMAEAVKGKPARAFARPAGIVYVPIDVKSGLLPSELTPAQFVVTEAFAKDRVPTKLSNVWAQAQVCTDNNKLATPGCPSVATGVFLKRPSPYSSSTAPEDAYLELPKEYCPLHGSGGQSVAVDICTDSRHQGIPYLANIPGPGQDGGCPPSEVQQQFFAPSQAPTQYCPLPQHKVSGATNATGALRAQPLVTEPKVKAKVVASGQGAHGYLVQLSWQAPRKDNVVFAVERSEQGRERRVNLGLVRNHSYVDTQVVPGASYTYWVVAVDQKDNASSSAEPVTLIIPPKQN